MSGRSARGGVLLSSPLSIEKAQPKVGRASCPPADAFARHTRARQAAPLRMFPCFPFVLRAVVAIVCATILGCATMPEPPLHMRRARRFASIASRNHAAGEMDKALLYYSRALNIYRGTDSRADTVECLQSVAVVHRELGNLDEATECAAEALVIARELGAARHEVDALATLGTVLYSQGDTDEAENYLREAMELARSIGYERAIADQRNSLGLVSKKRGGY